MIVGIELRRRLKAYIAEASARPFRWGVDDCSSWVLGWIEQERDIKIDAPAYRSESGAREIIKRAGDLADVWSAIAERYHIQETISPSYGDVGVMQTRQSGQVGFIMADTDVCLWRAETGVLGIRPRTIVKAWSI